MTRKNTAKREMSIKAALEWAFGTEHAQLDFDDAPQGARPGMSTIWLMMQRGALGCQIDGGGASKVADDADAIAGALAGLPVALGGKAMAADMAAWARAGGEPEWAINMTPRCVPRQWSRDNQFGAFAKTVVIETLEVAGKRGRRARFDVLACPVTYVPTASQIAMVRRRYLGWRLALHHLRGALVGVLDNITLTDEMPLSAPWSSLGDPSIAASNYKAA
ncbi:hypothetical protein [Cypionkella sp.]|uniref:hypothetical protein n=1 Tax=Cypionkella sp. TaxID=2811411 RepID=UPI00271AF5F6|nr:hypothetical protein [Cypionkella sp.]MDO8982754.1 hypothetical protein [Cypionkella sp.]MDP2051915.1 hypothetical protein [Cypionkella sp.]